MPNSMIETFFKDYERHSNGGDTDLLISQFADVFVVAAPQQPQAVDVKTFKHVVLKRKKLFDDLGCRSTELVSFRETALDSRCTLVDTQWRLTFVSADHTDIIVGSTFIVSHARSRLKIISYSPHQEIMKILVDRGLLPCAL